VGFVSCQLNLLFSGKSDGSIWHEKEAGTFSKLMAVAETLDD
jgi:hypothetical protein